MASEPTYTEQVAAQVDIGFFADEWMTTQEFHRNFRLLAREARVLHLQHWTKGLVDVHLDEKGTLAGWNWVGEPPVQPPRPPTPKPGRPTMPIAVRTRGEMLAVLRAQGQRLTAQSGSPLRPVLLSNGELGPMFWSFHLADDQRTGPDDFGDGLGTALDPTGWYFVAYTAERDAAVPTASASERRELLRIAAAAWEQIRRYLKGDQMTPDQMPTGVGTVLLQKEPERFRADAIAREIARLQAAAAAIP